MISVDNKSEKRESFLIRITGDFYDFASGFAVPILVYGTPIFLILFGLTFICHFEIVCNLFSLVSGFSLLFIAYIISLILVLDLVLLYRVYKAKPPKNSTTVLSGSYLFLKLCH